jgi:hypothetical protein
MVRATLTQRVEAFEQVVGDLATLPARVTAVEHELAGFRTEVRQEFAAVRSELRGEIRGSCDALATDLRAEMRSGNESLKKAIEDGDEQTRRDMRLLYEDLVTRIATLGEGR